MATNSRGLLSAAFALLLTACVTAPEAAPICAAGGVRIDISFERAGQHRCLEASPGRFVLSVDPEAQPINPSPWFAFRVHAQRASQAQITLRYTNADHRYGPKLASNNAPWRALEAERLVVDDEQDTATLTLALPAGGTIVAAQPIETISDTMLWARRTLRRAGFRELEYGRSHEDRPLIAFVGGGEAGDGMILAMTHQHPPETTGADAFRAFVDAIAADTPDMRALRARHRVVLAPMTNPDGVARGHWRQNAGGMDLNRDWGRFSQPETAALRDLILTEAQERRVVAFIDFHSTRRSVVYAPPLDAASPSIGLLPFLEQRLNSALSAPLAWSYGHDKNAGVSKAWALEALASPAITLELADTADADEAERVGRAAAQALAAYFAASPTIESVDNMHPGARRFRFANWAGPPLNVWLLRATTAGADAPVLFVMHGVGRDGDRYLREWADLAEAHGAVLVAPEFSNEAFPSAANYNLGAVLDEHDRVRPRALWTYGAIEPIFDAVVTSQGLTASGYRLYGHSAGAQFVHRFAMLGAGARMQRAVAANAGWYAFPNTDAPWPHGLAGGPPAPRNLFAIPLHIVIGDSDNDPNHASLSRTPGAMAQGPHRFARGQAFYSAAQALAGDGLAWSCSIAPGLAHDNALAARYAASLLFAAAPPAPGACRTLPAIR